MGDKIQQNSKKVVTRQDVWRSKMHEAGTRPERKQGWKRNNMKTIDKMYRKVQKLSRYREKYQEKHNDRR